MCYVQAEISIGVDSPVFIDFKRERLCFIAIDKKGGNLYNFMIISEVFFQTGNNTVMTGFGRRKR